MRAALATLCLLIATPALAQSPADDAAIRDLVGKYVNSRDLGSADAVAALFTEDADQYTIYGEWRRGRATIVPGVMRASQTNPGDRRITIESVRFLNPDTALVDGPYVITPPNGQPQRNWTSFTVSRTPTGWRIAAIRNAFPTTRP